MPQSLCTAVTNADPNSCTAAHTSRIGKPWQVSNQGLAFLAVWESGTMNGWNFQHHFVTDGMILTVYLDNRGLPTIGCGHLIVPADNLRLGDNISLERARSFFRNDLRRIEQAVNTKVMVPLHQHEYDALVSLTFNCGPGDAATAIANRMNTGDYDGMPAVILQFRSDSHHHHRRVTEARMFEQGIYDASH